MRAKAKYAVIYRHREQYPVSVMCKFFSVSRSGYYSFVKRMNRPEKDAALAETIRQQQDKCFHTYGYRRMWQWLKGSKRIYHNPKTILRVMKKYGLLAEIRRHRKWQQMLPLCTCNKTDLWEASQIFQCISIGTFLVPGITSSETSLMAIGSRIWRKRDFCHCERIIIRL